MNKRKLKAAVVGTLVTGGVVAGVAFLLTKPLFFVLGLVILVVIWLGVNVVGPYFVGEDE